MATLNSNPVIAAVASTPCGGDSDLLPRGVRQPITPPEIFDLIRHVRDPEHEELTLEQLRVAYLDGVAVDETAGAAPVIRVQFTPTIPHCSMATLIGLCLSVKLIRSLPPRFKVAVSITPGTHASEDDINKQLADKERVAAALENPHLLKVVNKCVAELINAEASR
ncbi:hypothetical protein M885DRAFT_520930 [Pelagophyceae sp. CCMP2097]|nr:hypothetical protein M885DRAFT_520930 [Pelagophyceae sp. CCMP2097]|mmetsp:Transcript_4856/g.15393  ORF Transcript_4856/g.15393 Transcript_4856/m.15393 type:complete len:166 (+) Transcript_4856:111-608(+)